MKIQIYGRTIHIDKSIARRIMDICDVTGLKPSQLIEVVFTQLDPENLKRALVNGSSN